MQRYNRLIWSYLLGLILFSLLSFNATQAQTQNAQLDSLRFYSFRKNNFYDGNHFTSDATYCFFNEGLNYFAEKKDTLNSIILLIDLSEIARLNGRYGDSFDRIWEALYLSTISTEKENLPKIHRKLAALYELFGLEDETSLHINKAMTIARDILLEDDENAKHLNSCYMNLTVKNRRVGNYDLALTYLDSCIISEKLLDKTNYTTSFIDAERGYIYLKLGILDSAEYYLRNALDDVKNNSLSYRSNVIVYFGELKWEQGQKDSALFYLKKGLEDLKQQSKSKHQVLDVLRKISSIYDANNQKALAFEYLNKAMSISDSLQVLRNQSTRELFDLKSKYLYSLQEKDEQLKEQDEIIEKARVVQSRLLLILFLVILMVVVVAFVVRTRLKLKQTLLQKKEAEMELQLKEERNRVQMELKSKELTSYALQLIDKDQSIDELLEVIKVETPGDYKRMQNKYKKGSDDLWESFNLRFTEVNGDFYDRLREKHPELSNTEFKHCALIKLHFGTKEMARILNIEPHSVHISRSRIRKKIGLERSESLEKYIESL